MVTLTTLTPNAALQSLQSDGIAALGLTAPLLSPVWSGAAMTYDASALTLTAASAFQIPFLGILETLDAPDDVYDVSGATVPGRATRIRMHPQAAMRLETLAAGRYASAGQPFIHPVATQAVIRAAIASPLAPQWWEPGDDSTLTGVISFHDRRGLIVDPVAVAAMYSDLLTAFTALRVLSPNAPNQGATPTDAGGIVTIAAQARGTLVHVVDPHGAGFVPRLDDHTLTSRNGAAVTATLPASGLMALPAGQTLQASNPDAADLRLRWGWSNGGTLARTALAAPTLPAAGNPVPNLPRQFLRLTAVDLPWHLLGNRSDSVVQAIPRDDGDFPSFYQPRVRAEIPVTYLRDGVSVLADSAQVIGRIAGAGATGMVLAVSPVLDAGVGVPPAGNATGRWPQFPAPVGPPGGANPPTPATGLTATRSGASDVVVTIAAGMVPVDSHIRIYPQQFVEITAIGKEPSFLRGDGGAAIALPGATQVLLRNPFRLLAGQPFPASPRLTLDIVVKLRAGKRRLFAGVAVNVAQGPVAAPADPFAAPDVMSTVPAMVQSVCPVPLFGMTRPSPPPGGLPQDPVSLMRRLASEETPRQGPRLPAQAKFETIVVTGIPNPAAVGGVLNWDGVLSGGRWAQETRSALHGEGNPGNPAGADVHAAGVRVGGDLALDMARHAMRCAQPIIPLPATPGVSPGWIVMTGGNNFNEPSFQPPPGLQTPLGAGALLRTVAAVCDTPELSLSNATLPTGPVVFATIVGNALQSLGLTGVTPPTIANEDRLATEVAREFYFARHGSHDALWALRRAIGQARELVYIEGPQFAKTARPQGAPLLHEIDLVDVLANRMQSQKSLRVVICVPREGDFGPQYKGWVRQAVAARIEAVNALKAIDEKRVAVFHAKGFAGRQAQIRTTVVTVDDAWCMVGTSHWRRRGMTFDSGADIVSTSYGFAQGYSAAIAAFRRDLMMLKLGLDPLSPTDQASAEFTLLNEPRPAFKLIADLLAQGGAGFISPLWEGPQDTAVLPANANMADPDGTSGASFISSFAALLSELGD
jgi:hypothetical protein